MSRAHWFTIIGAIFVALLLIAGMILGYKTSLERYTGVDSTIRDLSIALWAFLLPSWFTLEEAWFAPKDPDKLADFYALQKRARATWLVVAGAVAIVIGTTAPDSNEPGGTVQQSSVNTDAR